jgi:hypothetical protein
MAVLNDMIANYNFKDLSKFIEDLKFLFARGGGAEEIDGDYKPRSVMQKIWGILFIAVQIILLFLVIIYTYKLLTGGYPRFLIDMLTFKFSNKLNTTKEFGGTDGIFFKQIYEMTEPPLSDGVLRVESSGVELRDTDLFSRDIFQAVKDNIENVYEPLAKYEKTSLSLQEYYLYHDVIFDALGFKQLVDNNQPNIKTRSEKIKNVVDNVIGNYLEFYTKTTQLENNVNCSFIDGSSQKDRKKNDSNRKAKENILKEHMNTYDMKRVDTSRKFAERFPNISDNPQCTSSLSDYYNAIINNDNRFKNLRQSALQLQRLMGDIQRRKANTKQERLQKNNDIKAANKAFKQTRIDIVSIQRNAMNEAMDKQDADQQKMNKNMEEGTFTKGYFRTLTQRVKGLVNYKEQDFTVPNNEVQKGKNFSIYVPYFSVYHLYYNANKSRFDTLYKDLSTEEVIAFLFLKDIEDVIEAQTNATSDIDDNGGNNSKTIKSVFSVCERLIQNFWVYEKLGYTVTDALANSNVKDLLTCCQYISFEDKNRMDKVFTEVVANKDKFIVAYSNRGAGLIVEDNYSYYWLEILHGIYRVNANQAVYENFRNEFQGLITDGDVVSRKNSILAFLNLPINLQGKEDVRVKFDISRELYVYMVTHPLFVAVYLSFDNHVTYNKVIGIFMTILNDNPEIKKLLLSPQSFTVTEVKNAIDVLENDIAGTKRCLLTLQLCNMYINQYKTELTLKPRGNDKNNKEPSYSQFISKVGYKTLTNDQIIVDYETFFKRLFKPFYIDFIEGRMIAAWRRAFDGKKFDPNNNTGYWREFRSLYVDYYGRNVSAMKDGAWRQLSKYAKPRWGKQNEFDKT